MRTVKVQKKLRRHNRNAAPAEGEIASSHLAGITVDIQRRGLSREQIKWVQDYMRPLKDQGLIEPEEERHQWVFHVMVSGRYTDWRESMMLAGEQPIPTPAETAELPAAVIPQHGQHPKPTVIPNARVEGPCVFQVHKVRRLRPVISFFRTLG